ncbi:phage tail tape measure protein [Acinetobacter sp. Ac_3412]|uniref:tape measure protein n=1 Tax=Acinetobacter sp. Ac_3412 TaxID=1848935 RepID=UPI00148F75F3|nr:tape measure protein [Acinetobacter sp. Ac_3412]NNP75567.1 phage tail tape measure protein [Acinetobacter sp. Ac_3412]
MTQESRLVIVIDSRNAARNARNLSDELNSIERNGDFATRSTDRLSVATRRLAGYMAGLVTIGAAVSKMDAYTNLYNKLKVVTETQEQLNGAMKDTFDIAQRVGAQWESVNDVYSKYVANSKTLNLNQEQLARLTEITTKAVAMSGSTAQAAAGALFQYGQSIDGNILRAQEYNSLVDGAGGLLNAMAKGLNVTRGELRQMMLDGKLTGEVITQALLKAGDSVDQLYAKTDTSIGQTLAQLNNEITKFVGEAGKGSGAAQAIAKSIQYLAFNLETLTNVAMVGGAYWLGTLIPVMYKSVVAMGVKTKTLAMQITVQYAAIQAERAAAAQEVVNAQAKLASLQATRVQLIEELKLELQRKKSQISTQGAINSEIRLGLLRRQQAVINAELAATENALAAAQTRTAAAGAASMGAGRALLGVLGGPVGLGLTVAGVAATYLLMRNNGDEANKMLRAQTNYASMAAEELNKLSGAQLRAAEQELSKELNVQSLKLQKVKNDFEELTEKVLDSNRENKEAYRIWAELKSGTIEVEQAFERLNRLDFISSEQINQLVDSKKKVDDQQGAVEKANEQLNLAKSAGANAKQGFSDAGKGASDAAQDIAKFAEKLKDVNKTLTDRLWDNEFKKSLIEKFGATEQKAELLLQTYRKNQEKGFEGVTVQQEKLIDQILNQESAIDKLIDKDKERTKELEKQAKLSQRLIGISGNSGVGTGAHLDVRYGGSRDGQKVSKEHLARLQAGGKALSSYRVSSDYGQRKAPTAGASSFHKGIDFAMPVGTPITTTVAVKDVKTAYDAKGGGYYSTVTFEDGVVLKLLHQAPSMMSKVKGGPSDGTYKSNLDLEKQANEVARNQIQLQMAVADEITRIRQNLADDLKEIDKAGYSDDEARKLKAQYQVQANNDIAIAQQAIRTRLDDYKAFTKTEEQLLRDSFARRQFEALHDLELTKSQRQEAVNLLSQQEQQELALIKLSQEQRLYQSKLFLLSESEAIRERYRLERKEIEKTTKDEDERRKRLALSREQERLEQFNKAAQASKNWGSTYTEMTGNNQLYQLDQTRQDRTSQSLAVADSQNADVMTRAQDPNADMEALAAEQEAIWQAHRDRMALIDQDYWSKTSGYQLGMASDLFGSLTGLAEGYAGKQSGIYRGMAAAQHAFSLFSVAANSFTAISSAWASAPFPANLPAVGTATLETGLLQAALKALSPQGFAAGGYTGDMGRGDIAGVVHGQEYVLNAAATKRVGVDTLNAINSGRNVSGRSNVIQPQVVINNNAPARVSTQTGADGKLYVTIDEVENFVSQSLGRPNSPISKSLGQNTNAGRRR